MKVQKSNGTLQDFDIEKIKLVIGRVSDEVDESLNSSDINTISKEVLETVKREHNEVVVHSDLRQIVYKSLKDYGFTDVANAYMRG